MPKVKVLDKLIAEGMRKSKEAELNDLKEQLKTILENSFDDSSAVDKIIALLKEMELI